MNIHYLATSKIPSGSANSLQIVKMCEALKCNGHDVKLIVPNYISNINSITNFYYIKNKFCIRKIGKQQKDIKGLYNIIIPIFLVLDSLKDRKAQLVITRNIIVSLILIILRKKHILELHDDLRSFGKLISQIFKLFYLLNSKYIYKVIFITNNLKDFISKKYNYFRSNYEILPDATEIKNFNIKKNLKAHLNIGYFGSIYNSRGIDIILKLSKIDKINKYFIYGGDENEIARIKKKMKSTNLSLNARVPYRTIKNLLHNMDILLMPFKDKVTVKGNIGDTSRFMSPLKMFDYLGAAKIILSSEIEVLKEILKNNFNCIFIKNFNNIYSWKKEIDKIRISNAKYLILRKNALKTALLFTWKKRAVDMIR